MRERQKIAFDLDGCLITIGDKPRYYIIDLLIFFLKLGDWDVYVWSGGGIDYAQRWVEKLGFEEMVKVIGKASLPMDIVVDDEIEPKDCPKIKAKVVIQV